MEIFFMVFMVMVSIMALFAIMVVFRDIANEVILSKKERAAANRDVLEQTERILALIKEKEEQKEAAAVAAIPEPEPVPVVVVPEPEPMVEEPVIVEAPAEEPVACEEPAVEVAEEPEDDEGKISFSTGQRQTLEEKYLALSSEARGWYDEIIKYASAVEGSKRYKNIRYEEYKVGKNRLVRLLIKRGVIQCEFILHNSDFKNYINENKISVKQSATTMLVENAATVDAVKNSIDIVVDAIAEEKEYKKKLAREKRKAAKAAAATAQDE